MQTGLNLQALAQATTDRRAITRDYRINQSALAAVIRETEERGERRRTVGFEIDDVAAIRPSTRFHAQAANSLGIPKAYDDRMLTEAPELSVRSINTWLGADGSHRRFVRLLADGQPMNGRALLGASYRPIDGYDMLAATLPALSDLGTPYEIRSANVTEENFYLALTFPRRQREVAVGDVVEAGAIIQTNEVGTGRALVRFMTHRLVCRNGMVVGNEFARRHVGSMDIDVGKVDYQDDTIQAQQVAMQKMIRDALTGCAAEQRIDEAASKLREAAGVKMAPKSPQKFVEVVARHESLNQTEGERMLANLLRGTQSNTFTLFDVIQATTALAHDGDYDRGVEMAQLGGALPKAPAHWAQITAEADALSA